MSEKRQSIPPVESAPLVPGSESAQSGAALEQSELMTLEHLKAHLAAQGFRFGKQPLWQTHNECQWYAWRRTSLPARECETNGNKCQLVVTPYRYEAGSEEHESVTLDVTGEAGGLWYKLEAYSMKPREAFDQLSAVEAALVRAWNALVVDAAPTLPMPNPAARAA